MDIFQNPQKTNDGVVYYETPDAISAKPLLLVHGSFGSARMWGQLITYLTAYGHAVITMDLPGHGASEGALDSLDMDDYVDGIESVTTACYSKPIVVGHSMAGLLALMAAERGIAEHVISIDPSPTKEVQGEVSTEGIPDVYTVSDAGMSDNLNEIKAALTDIDENMLKRMQAMLGPESGTARKQRKRGISIPESVLEEKEVLFIGAEKGDSVPFGISKESTGKMAEHYNKPLQVIKAATHPGVLMGRHANKTADAIVDFLS